MEISGIQGNCNISGKTCMTFKRQLTPSELKVYTESVNKGLQLLDKKVDIIIHNSAAPAVKYENTGIGSLFSRTVQKALIPFLKSHGISGIQQEPNNLRKIGDYSPYAPESSAKNIYMIPLEKLASEEYNFLLPKKIFNSIVGSVKNYENVDYEKINLTYDSALRIVFTNFKQGNFLQKEFQEYIAANDNIEKNAIFRLLNKNYKSNWENWNGIDKRLYAPRNEQEKILAEKRIKSLKDIYGLEIEYFKFLQFLIDLENKESNRLAQKTGIKIIGDSPVASPAADEWIHQDLLLNGKAIGCPPDAFSDDGQRWGFKYFNPKYIFNPDGSLGKAGKILKDKYDQFFASFPGGLRIDHVIGLVDPFIYDINSKKMPAETVGRIYSYGEFKKKPHEYSNILEKIVLQSAKDHGMDKSSIICEDLGEPNLPTINVMKELKLSGIGVTQFDYRGADMQKNSVIMLGSHDNLSFIEYTNNLFKYISGKNIDLVVYTMKIINYINNLLKIKEPKPIQDINHFLHKTELLAKDTAPAAASEKEIQRYKKAIRSKKNQFISSSFTELFTSPARRVQIFFADFWGIGKTYNRPGTSKGNWTLRINNEFEKTYYEAVADGRAPNLAQIIASAIRQRGLVSGNEELLGKLDVSAKILSEK